MSKPYFQKGTSYRITKVDGLVLEGEFDGVERSPRDGGRSYLFRITHGDHIQFWSCRADEIRDVEEVTEAGGSSVAAETAPIETPKSAGIAAAVAPGQYVCPRCGAQVGIPEASAGGVLTLFCGGSRARGTEHRPIRLRRTE